MFAKRCLPDGRYYIYLSLVATPILDTLQKPTITVLMSELNRNVILCP